MAEQPSFLELIMDRGPRPGLKFSLTRPSVTIGRGADSDFVIDDPEVSRRHARLTWDGQQVIVEDLGSANGTFVNGVRLTAPCALRPGDTLALAQTIAFRAAPPPMAPPGLSDATLPSGPQPASAPVAPPPAIPRPPGGQAPPRPKRPVWTCILPVLLVSLCVCGAAIGGLVYYWQNRQNMSVPLVSFVSPENGVRVEMEQPVRVDLVAYDTKNKITRLELWVDGHLREATSSDAPGGMSPLPLSVDWQAETTGAHTLAARAYNRRGTRGHVAISIEASEPLDRDRDGLRDAEDACPDEPGQPSANGCPDRDLDGIADNADACPDQPGPPEHNGCPNPQSDDRDGDGVLDAVDACPDASGPAQTNGCPDRDGDGVADAADACPDERGSPGAGGCPDQDGDAVPDATDQCPYDPGPPELGGCPDRDGDGLRDREDACPDAAGQPERLGCPDTGAGDRDGDGVPDDVDAMPDHAGDPADGGAPAPGEGEDSDDDGVADADELPEDPLDGVDPGDMVDPGLVAVELQALEFAVGADYDEVYCYAGIVGEDMEQFGPFEPMGEGRWNIADFLGGDNSRVLTIPRDQPLELQVDGGAQCIFMDEEGGWGTYFDLGQVIREHSEEDWDGHVINATSEGGDAGHRFTIQYRLCRDSCEGAALQRPLAYLVETAGETWLCWRWEGNEEDIEGFRLYLEDFGPMTVRPDRRSHSIQWYEPPCGNSRTFSVAAYRGELWSPDYVESPRSNDVAWTSPGCALTVQVTFDRISTGPDLEITQPIHGAFWVVGSSGIEILQFKTYDRFLASSSTYSIMDYIFAATDEDLARLGESCECYAPTTNSAIVGLELEDTLTFGGNIYHGDDNEQLWYNERAITAQAIAAEYSMSDRNLTVRVLLNVIGP